MLTQIHIRNLATISEAELHLENGSTMITGETGAGKSIFIEAIEIALGARTANNIIRVGAERADISLSFDISNQSKVIEWLNTHDINQDNSNECIIRRVITHDGRTRSSINGLPSTLQLVRQLSELLFHLHSQYEQQILLKVDYQREMLDRYADHIPLANQVKNIATDWKNLHLKIKNLKDSMLQRKERRDYLRYQLDELIQLNLKENEWEALENEHHKLTHIEELISNLQHILSSLSDENNQGALTQVKIIQKLLDPLKTIDNKTIEWFQTLNSIAIQLDDLKNELQSYLDTAERDPVTLQTIETRISQIFDVARKHKVNPEELIALQKQFEDEMSALEISEEELNTLEKQQKVLEIDYDKNAKELSEKRIKASKQFSQIITATIQSLSLPHGEFSIKFEKNDVESNEISLHGYEKIIFLIKTNPDQIAQPLSKIISGGELSRLSLAIHLALSHRTMIPTLIFDEIDTGMSGATAEKIGKLLRELGTNYQVFCVTHQAQVAACGHHHLFVEKKIMQNTAFTELRLLKQKEKKSEIARMLGGEKITKTTLAHAEELLASHSVC